MVSSGAPPSPTNVPKEDSSVTMGPQMPAPASAVSPMSGMFPIYMRSTMPYSTLTSCATMAGIASRSTSRGILSLPKSFVRFMPVPLFSPIFRCSV